MTTQRPVVVGVDGSPGSAEALVWAAGAAALRGAPLQVVHALDLAPYLMTAGIAPRSEAYLEPRLLERAERLLAEQVERARAAAPRVPVTSRVVHATPTVALLDAAAGAALVAVGARGHHVFPSVHRVHLGPQLGSVGLHVAGHAPCPVVVVRPADGGAAQPAASAPVVVGVDGSAVSAEAVGFAVEEAALRRVPLRAVHAWTVPPVDLVPAEEFSGARVEDSRRLLSEALAGFREEQPNLRVEECVVNDHPVHGLVHQSADARLLVVGSHGRGAFAGLLLGSVSHGVIRQAPCPVAVVRTSPGGRHRGAG